MSRVGTATVQNLKHVFVGLREMFSVLLKDCWLETVYLWRMLKLVFLSLSMSLFMKIFLTFCFNERLNIFSQSLSGSVLLFWVSLGFLMNTVFAQVQLPWKNCGQDDLCSEKRTEIKREIRIQTDTLTHALTDGRRTTDN